jgi:inhibitor of cysteine peptidase
MRQLILLTVLAGLLSACGQPLSVTDVNDGEAVAIEVGQELEVSLPANPSTGFGWTVVIDDPSVLGQVGDPEFVSDSEELVGAGGMLTMHFVGLAEGSSGLRLEYERPFEDVEPEDTFTLDVTVG